MAGGPYKGNGGWYHIKWSDTHGHPEQPKKGESLRTTKKKVADNRKSILETLYPKYHDPWSGPWYKNEQIKHIVESGHLDLDSLANNLNKATGTTIGRLVEEYIAYKTKLRGPDGWGDKMSSSAPYTLRSFAKFIGCNKDPDRIDDFDVQDFLYQPDITSDYTRQSYLSRIKACFNWGIREGVTANKITYKAQPPQKQIPVFLTRQEIIDICGYHLQKNHKNIKKGFTKKDNTSLWMIYAWLVLASTGMRPEQLMNLKIRDVKPVLQIGKNNRVKNNKERTIRYYRWTEPVLDILLDTQIRNSDRWMRKRDWLFGRHGPQSQRHLQDHFREARRELFPGKDVSLYNLKDSFAVWYLTNETELSGNQDRRLYELMRILGHAKLSTTQIYLKAIPLATELE